MSNAADTATPQRFVLIRLVERLGNSLPHPFFIFAVLAILVIMSSAVMANWGVSVLHPKTQELLAIKSLLSTEGLQWMLTDAIHNFISFKPLGLVVVMTMGIGLAEQVGLLNTALRSILLWVPKSALTLMVFFAGIVGNLASDAAVVMIPPLAALVFLSAGRHPVAGLISGFAAVSSGFTANIFITGTDALLSGITQEVTSSLFPDLTITPLVNWYFMAFSVVFLMGVGWFITDIIMEPRLGRYQGESGTHLTRPSEIESRALRTTMLVSVLFVAVFAILTLPTGAPLRDPELGTLVPSAFLRGLVTILVLYFVVCAVTFGITSGKLSKLSQVPEMMAEGVRSLSGFMVMAFAMAQFIAYFKWTGLSVFFAVKGSEMLQAYNLTGIGLILGFVGFAALLNLLITSGSAQWALMAPIFVPMMSLVGLHPAFTQLCFRIADSSTNTISPLNVYLPMVLLFLQRYQPKAGLGNLIALMLPYAFGFLVTWTVLLIVWMSLGWDIGIGGFIYIP